MEIGPIAPVVLPPPVPSVIEVGATPVFLKKPEPMKFGPGKISVKEITLQAMTFNETNLQPGLDKAVILMKDPGDPTKYKPLQVVGSGESVPWEKVYGVMITDEAGDTKIIEQKDLSLTRPTPESALAPAPESAPGSVAIPERPPLPTPFEKLKARATEPDNKSISMVAARGKPIEEELAAKRSDAKLKKENIFGKIWKGNLAVPNIREHARQFIHEQNEAARMLLSNESLDHIEAAAKQDYIHWVENVATKGEVIKSKISDWFARQFGGYTKVERFAVDEAGMLSANGDLARIDKFVDKLKATQVRYETNFTDDADVIQRNRGEDLKVIKAGKKGHAEIIKSLQDSVIHPYLEGTMTDQQLQTAVDTLVNGQFTGGETKIYASSIIQLAKDYKAQFDANALDRPAIDAELANLDIRIGEAQMGESTHLESNATAKIIEKMMSRKGFWGGVGKGVAALSAGTFNEASMGTFAASVVTLSHLPQNLLPVAARSVAGPGLGFGVAAAVGSKREFTLLKIKYFDTWRAQERGEQILEPNDKLGKFMKDHAPPLVKVDDIISNMTKGIYERGRLKANLTSDELQTTLANLADAKARRHIGARGGKENVGLIEWGSAVDVNRTRLDLSIKKLEQDLSRRYTTPLPEFGNTSLTDYVRNLTNTQVRVLTEGTKILEADNAMVALKAVSADAPSVKLLRRRFLIGPKEEQTFEGLDAILKQANRDLAMKAIGTGTKRAAIGTALGLVASEGITDALHHSFVGPLSQMLHVQEHMPAARQLLDQVFHIGKHVTTEVQAPMHLTEVHNLPTYTNSQGLPEVIHATIPDNTNLVAVAGHPNMFSLVDAHGTPLVHDIIINDHGAITGWNAQEAIAHRFHFDQGHQYAIETVAGSHTIKPVTEAVPITKTITENVPAAGTSSAGFTITEAQMGNNGPWDWILKNLNNPQSGVHNVIPTTNCAKNLFRYWVDQQHHNIMDAKFDHVPDALNTNGQLAIGHLMDKARLIQDQYMAAHHIASTTAGNYPGWKPIYDAIDAQNHAAAVAWKVGYVDIKPTQADFDLLTHAITTPTTVTETINTIATKTSEIPVFTPPTYETLFHSVITQTLPKTTLVMPAVQAYVPSVVPVIPLPREGIKSTEPRPTLTPLGPTPKPPEPPPGPEPVPSGPNPKPKKTPPVPPPIPPVPPTPPVPPIPPGPGPTPESIPGSEPKPRSRRTTPTPEPTPPGPESIPTPDVLKHNLWLREFDQGEPWISALELLKSKLDAIAAKAREMLTATTPMENQLQMANVGVLGHEAFRTFDPRAMETDHLKRLKDGIDLFSHTMAENAGRYRGLQPIDIPRIPDAQATTREFLVALPQYTSLPQGVQTQITNQLDVLLTPMEGQPEMAKLTVVMDLLGSDLKNGNGQRILITGLNNGIRDKLLDNLWTYRSELLYRDIDVRLAGAASTTLTKVEADRMAQLYPSLKILTVNYYAQHGMIGVPGREERAPRIEFFRKEDGTFGAKAWDETAVYIMDAVHQVRNDEFRSYAAYAPVAREHLDMLIKQSEARLLGLKDKQTDVWLTTITEHPAYAAIRDHVTGIVAETPAEYLDDANRNLSFGIITEYLLSEPGDSNLKLLLTDKINQLDSALPVYDPDTGDALPILNAIQTQTTQPQIQAFMAIPPKRAHEVPKTPPPRVENPLLQPNWVRNNIADARKGGLAGEISFDTAIRFKRPAEPEPEPQIAPAEPKAASEEPAVAPMGPPKAPIEIQGAGEPQEKPAESPADEPPKLDET